MKHALSRTAGSFIAMRFLIYPINAMNQQRDEKLQSDAGVPGCNLLPPLFLNNSKQ